MKVVACHVKPYQLNNRDDNSDGNYGDSQVMVDDGLLDKVKKDAIDYKCIKMENSEYFN